VTKVCAILNRCDSIITDAEKRRANQEKQKEEQEEEPPPGSNDETHSPTGELHDLPGPSEASPVPDGDDEPDILQRGPLPKPDPDEPPIRPTEMQEI
jgi:hypothetical protein